MLRHTHLFADLRTLRNSLTHQVCPVRKSMSWVTRRAFARRLENLGILQDALVAGVCAAALMATAIVVLQRKLLVSISYPTFALALGLALFASYRAAASLRKYAWLGQPLDDKKLAEFFALVQVDWGADRYLETLVDCNEYARNVDAVLARLIAEERGGPAALTLERGLTVSDLYHWRFAKTFS